MTSLVSTVNVRALVKTSLTDAQLQEVIDRVEAEITGKIGAPQDDGGTVTVTLTLEGEGSLLFLPTEIASIINIVEDGASLDATNYRTWSGGVIERLPEDAGWGDVNVVTYKSADDRSLRKQVIIELVRLDVERTAMQQEQVADYSYKAPNWDELRKRQFKRLMFLAV